MSIKLESPTVAKAIITYKKKKKPLQKSMPKTRRGTEICIRSCRLRDLEMPGTQCQELKCEGVCETIQSGRDCGKPRDTCIIVSSDCGPKISRYLDFYGNLGFCVMFPSF